MTFSTNFSPVNIAVIGASGGIGHAFVEHYTKNADVQCIYATSRSGGVTAGHKVQSLHIDIQNEESLKTAVKKIKPQSLDLCIIATGALHDDDIAPEKKFEALNIEKMQQIFAVNTFGPAMVMKYFIPLMRRDRKSVMAFLSARLGSIGDNRLGGWYSYRASKAGLNMLIKTAAIEMSRRAPEMQIIGLHPGTVNTGLSKPFHNSVPAEKLFSPAYAVTQMDKIMHAVTAADSGRIFAWDGQEITP